MGRWTTPRSSCDPAQCWVELLQIWQSEGIKKSLLSRRSSLNVCSNVEGKLRSAEAEPINQPAEDFAQQSCWESTWHSQYLADN